MSEQANPWRPLAEFYPPGQAPVCKCPNYGLCGDYVSMGRRGSRPGKVAVRCGWCAMRESTADDRGMQRGAITPTEGQVRP